MRAVHHRLRQAMELARQSVDGEIEVPAGQDLLVFYRGFCSALSGHHHSEDTRLFPQLRAVHPEPGPVIDNLMRDHNMLEHLLGGFADALSSDADPAYRRPDSSHTCAGIAAAAWRQRLLQSLRLSPWA